MPALTLRPLRAMRTGFCVIAMLLFSGVILSAAEGTATPARKDSGQIPANNPAVLLAEANDAFTNAGRQEAQHPIRARELYQAAALRFEALASTGTQNGKLFYNLGNTYFKLGQTGKAILNYKEALRYLPGDPNLLHNLERARAQRKDRIPPAEETGIFRTLLFWHYDLSLTARQAIFAAIFLLFWAGMLLRRFLPGRGIPRRWIIAVCGILCAAFLFSLILQPLEYAAHRGGVILQSEVIARKGNGDNYQPAFQQPLHEGTEFTVLEERPGWLEVSLADGRRCWLPEEATGLLR